MNLLSFKGLGHYGIKTYFVWVAINNKYAFLGFDPQVSPTISCFTSIANEHIATTCTLCKNKWVTPLASYSK
jgi:hypothetical protein